MITMNTANLSNHPSSLSRRQWIRSGLTTCGYLAAGGLVSGKAQDDPAPEGYTRPGPVPERGRARGMQIRRIAGTPGGEDTYAVIFGKGDEVLSGLTEFAEHEKLTSGHFTRNRGLAARPVRVVRCGATGLPAYSHRGTGGTDSFNGDIGVVNGAPQVHVHGAVGLSDGRMRGGHLLEAIVWPTLEVFFTTWPTSLIKTRDEETTLSLFDLNT